MPSPFYNAIKGTCTAAAATGNYTPTAAANGYRAWTNVPTGWVGLVRFEDGVAAWEYSYSYWDGTTVSRSNSAFHSSSSGSPLSLTASATAAMVMDGAEVMSHLGGTPAAWWRAIPNSAVITSQIGVSTLTATGTAAAAALAATNFLTEQPRVQITSATTANAQAGLTNAVASAVVSTTAGRGGFEFCARFGATTLPTGPRLFVGMTGTTFVANTADPSSLTANMAVFGKDSADTSIQLMVNSAGGNATKTSTGIALVANGWYEGSIWCEPGSNTVNALLIRLDGGSIWYGTTATDVPVTGALMFPQVIGGLSATTGTAFVLQAGSITLRNGS